MVSNLNESNTLTRKRHAPTLKDIIEAANQGVEAPSEIAKKVTLSYIS